MRAVQAICPVCGGNHLPISGPDRQMLRDWVHSMKIALLKHENMLHNHLGIVSLPPLQQLQQRLNSSNTQVCISTQSTTVCHGCRAAADANTPLAHLSDPIPSRQLHPPGSSGELQTSMHSNSNSKSQGLDSLYVRPAFVIAPGTSLILPSSEGMSDDCA